MRDTQLKGMKNGIGLSTEAGGPESSQKGEAAAVRHFVHLLWIPAPPCPSPTETEQSVQEVMLLWSREDRWEVAAAL